MNPRRRRHQRIRRKARGQTVWLMANGSKLTFLGVDYGYSPGKTGYISSDPEGKFIAW